MNLLIIRHAEANDFSKSNRDYDRELSAKGITNFTNLVINFKNLFEDTTHILTSPYIRTKQTADIIVQNISNKIKLTEYSELAPGSSNDDLFFALKSLDAENICVVSHQPNVSNYINYFCGDINIYFRKGGIAKIIFKNKLEKYKGVLDLFIHPKAIKKGTLTQENC